MSENGSIDSLPESVANIPSPNLSDYKTGMFDTDDDSRDGPSSKSKPKKKSSFHQGRKLAWAWEHFSTTKVDGKIISNKCKKCKQNVSARSQRMQEHLKRCQKTESRPPKVPTKSTIRTAFASAPGVPASVPNVRKTMHQYIRKLDSSEKDDINMLLGKFIFSANLSFSTVENPYFKELIKKLQPAYSVPSHDIVGNSILQKVYDETQETMTHVFKDQKVTIMQDGWSTKQSEPVICHSLFLNGKSYFLSSVCTEEKTKDANKCLELLVEAIDLAEAKFGCTITGVVTDNCSCMESMKRKLIEQRPEMIVYGCHSHLLNLIGQHLTSETVVEKVQSVSVYIRSHHFTSARLKQLQGSRPVLAGKTRWNSEIDSLISYTENHLHYVQILRELRNKKLLQGQAQKDKFASVLNIVNDSVMYDEIQELIKALSPVCVAIDKVN
jgi:uncharacterized protein DUF659